MIRIVFLMVFWMFSIINANEGYVTGVFPVEVQSDQEPKYAFSFTINENDLSQQVFVLNDGEGNYQNVYTKIFESYVNGIKIIYQTITVDGINELISIEKVE